jgi:DnaJ C terminal domain/DnaJ domain
VRRLKVASSEPPGRQQSRSGILLRGGLPDQSIAKWLYRRRLYPGSERFATISTTLTLGKAMSDNSMSAPQALEVLGLKQGATQEEIIAAYHRLIKRVHPDAGGSSFFAKQLNAAREALLKHAKACAEDGSGTSASQGQSDRHRPSEPSKPQRGEDVRATVTVPLATGKLGGIAHVLLPTGRAIEVKVPAGVKDGAQLRLRGLGRVGVNGRDPGDALVSIEIEPNEAARRQTKARRSLGGSNSKRWSSLCISILLIIVFAASIFDRDHAQERAYILPPPQPPPPTAEAPSSSPDKLEMKLDSDLIKYFFCRYTNDELSICITSKPESYLITATKAYFSDKVPCISSQDEDWAQWKRVTGTVSSFEEVKPGVTTVFGAKYTFKNPGKHCVHVDFYGHATRGSANTTATRSAT